MKIKKSVLVIAMSLVILILTGCSNSKSTKVSVLATTDLHGEVPYNLSEFIKNQKKKDKNITVVDAGDFFDGDMGGAMDKYFNNRREKNTIMIHLIDKYIECPITDEMKEAGYDAVILGNHEFIANNKFHLDNMISDFEKRNIDVLSANTYKTNNQSYTKPYIMKEINTKYGKVKLGILGLTIKEVGEASDGSLELKNQSGYKGKLYMKDLVKDAKKWVNVMKKKENPDIILTVVHSGEEPKHPKHPGNRVKELARTVDGIDAIVCGHNHVAFEKHNYKNSKGENVIVTEPGKFGEYISKITFDLVKEQNKWKIEDKNIKLTKLPKDLSEDNLYKFYGNILNLTKKTKETRLKKLASFDWDKMYVFSPKTSTEKIYKKVGYKWRSISEKDAEQVVFMKNGKVVCSYFDTGMKFKKSSYKDGIIEIKPDKNDKFTVKIGSKPSDITLSYIDGN